MKPRRPRFSGQYKRDRKRIIDSGEDIAPLDDIARMIIRGQKLPPGCKDHKLFGNYKGHRDCHINGDWVLIYRTVADEVIFVRTGSHAELFK
jgi:mRNA interferase YafQ